jgi:BirA family biotin operon repressor/biotin-[acetyl-CoA-carboxylase] ligase
VSQTTNVGLTADLERALGAAGARLGPFAGRVVVCGEVASTNDVAARLAEDGAPEGTTVVAHSQTAGRGRRGRRWFSPPGAGLYLSAVFRPPGLERLTLLAGVAVAEALDEVAQLAAEIKWPNDLVVRDGRGRRKLGGILAESATTGSGLPYVVLGIGINLRATAYPPDLAATAVSIAEATGREVDRGAVLVAVLAALARWRALVATAGPAPLVARWRDLAPTSEGAAVEIDWPGGRRRGVTAGIDAEGALLVRLGARIERVVSAEVTWL